MSLCYLILWNQVDILQKHFKKDHVHMRFSTRVYGIRQMNSRGGVNQTGKKCIFVLKKIALLSWTNPVTLYKCSVNNESCSTCLSPEETPPHHAHLGCGWCGSDCNVMESEVCQTNSFLNQSLTNMCPPPVISSVRGAYSILVSV